MEEVEEVMLDYPGILAALVNSDEAGIAQDEMGQHCLYCMWSHNEYTSGVRPKHDLLCPIILGRQVLENERD